MLVTWPGPASAVAVPERHSRPALGMEPPSPKRPDPKEGRDRMPVGLRASLRACGQGGARRPCPARSTPAGPGGSTAHPEQPRTVPVVPPMPDTPANRKETAVTVTPTPDDHSPEPAPKGPAGGHPDFQAVPGRIARDPVRNPHLTLDDFHAAYAVAVSTGDDPALDGLLLRHLLIEAARTGELVSLRYGDLNLTDATITVRDSRLVRAYRRPSPPEHVATLTAHAVERGPRKPAPPDAPEELRRAGVPALTAEDPVFYRRPVDTFDAQGFFVARRVRPVTGRRLTSLVARLRQHGAPELTASAVRALSIRLIGSMGWETEAARMFGLRQIRTTMVDAEAAHLRFGRLKRYLFADLPVDPPTDHPSRDGR